MAYLCCTTGKDNAGGELLVVVFELCPDIVEDFLVSGLDDINETAFADFPVVRVGYNVVAGSVLVFCPCTAIFQLEHFGFFDLCLQTFGNVHCDIIASKWDDNKFAEYVLGIEAYCGGVGTDIGYGTSRAFFCSTQYRVAQGQRGDEQFGNFKASTIDTFLNVLGQGIPCNDVEEVRLHLLHLNAHNIYFATIAGFVFLGYDFKYLGICIHHTAVCVHEFVNQSVGDLFPFAEGSLDAILYRVEGLAIDAHIDTGNCLT